MKLRCILSLAVIATLNATAVHAEESGGGHYIPGATATFVDALPSKPGLAMINMFTNYEGSASVGQSLDFGGNVAVGAKATVQAETVGAVYVFKPTILGGNYATALVVPYVWMTVKAQSELTGPAGRQLLQKNVSDSTNGIGDISIYPFMLGWQALGGQLKYDVRSCFYAPTGSYSNGQLANAGKNYWTFEPSSSVSWMSQKLGLEATLFTGIDFNTENNATAYQSGTQFHLDATVAQHMPLWGGLAGIGGTVFYYQQIEGDSGSGAALGGFEGHTSGIGPVVSYVRTIGKVNAFAEVKWLPELDVRNRTSGDYIWFKLGALF